jgi:hypothetical protein
MTRSPAFSGIASTERKPSTRTRSMAQPGRLLRASASTSGVQTLRSSAAARPTVPSPSRIVRPRQSPASPAPAAAMQTRPPASRSRRKSVECRAAKTRTTDVAIWRATSAGSSPPASSRPVSISAAADISVRRRAVMSEWATTAPPPSSGVAVSMNQRGSSRPWLA